MWNDMCAFLRQLLYAILCWNLKGHYLKACSYRINWKKGMFCGGSKSARGCPNPLADKDRGVQIRWRIWTRGSKSAVTTGAEIEPGPRWWKASNFPTRCYERSIFFAFNRNKIQQNTHCLLVSLNDRLNESQAISMNSSWRSLMLSSSCLCSHLIKVMLQVQCPTLYFFFLNCKIATFKKNCDWSNRVHYNSIMHAAYVTRVHYISTCARNLRQQGFCSLRNLTRFHGEMFSDMFYVCTMHSLQIN